MVVGPNGAGKTNLVEAVFLLATGRSFRAAKEEQMIRNGSELARVKAVVERRGGREELEVVLTRGEVGGERVARKRYLVDGVGKRRREFLGRLMAVVFRPEDMELVLGSPAVRREWLDGVLEQVDWEYRECSAAYKKGLRMRNRLLDEIREGRAQRSQLFYWDKLLIKNGQVIERKREEFLEFVNRVLAEGLGAEFAVVLEYDRSGISEQRLARYAAAELAAGATLVGPHRDEVVIKRKGGRRLAWFGSRGEQRLAVLGLKLAELRFLEEKKGEKPVLLLDDVFSELDEESRQLVWRAMRGLQSLVTTADEELVREEVWGRMKVVKLGGQDGED